MDERTTSTETVEPRSQPQEGLDWHGGVKAVVRYLESPWPLVVFAASLALAGIMYLVGIR